VWPPPFADGPIRFFIFPSFTVRSCADYHRQRGKTENLQDEAKKLLCHIVFEQPFLLLFHPSSFFLLFLILQFSSSLLVSFAPFLLS
jgi:hypothetical protein